MILVTGAAGKTGRAVVRALAARGARIRALVHRVDQIAALKTLGASEGIAGDMRIPATLSQAVQGVQAIYHICPNVSPDELHTGKYILIAARSAGVEHFVYHSVLHPQAEAMPHHWQKLRVEEQLYVSGLPYTILQPTVYMQNVLASWSRITVEGIYPVPYEVETRLSLVDLEDVAEAAALVLTGPGHLGATYELVGALALTQVEVAASLAQALGRPVRAEEISRLVWEQGVRAAGMGEYAVATLLKMFQYYERYGFEGNPNVLAWLLGRPPTSLAAFLERSAREYKPA